ncbi:hypothetical protein FISHEDRAFT_55927 [Fistulina hepatica ATCC 64428]|uniref:Uncharacterized protein n=1 Tax=Fistulina hepatica ATCC 64428 TaxID=1128425 RepID=A0A0D7AM82_9AGAR|nr:hypothetical protein FISHEDRAFT_55927 [Fistulina hepatica ATCC 64428]
MKVQTAVYAATMTMIIGLLAVLVSSVVRFTRTLPAPHDNNNNNRQIGFLHRARWDSVMPVRPPAAHVVHRSAGGPPATPQHPEQVDVERQAIGSREGVIDR